MNNQQIKNKLLVLILLISFSIALIPSYSSILVLANDPNEATFTPVLAESLDLQADSSKYPKTGSPEWDALSKEERLAASNDFYGMDKNLRQFFLPKKGINEKSGNGFSYYVYRKHPETGLLTRVPISWMRCFAYPGETLYIFIKLDTDNITTSAETFYEKRIGWGYHERLVHQEADGSFDLDNFKTYKGPTNVKLDGQRVERWDNKENVYGKTSTSGWPHPRDTDDEGKPILRQGHEVIADTIYRGEKHYLSFEYTLPDTLWFAAFTHGSGETGNASGTISARAEGFSIYPIAHIDVRYVLDSDYRTAREILDENSKLEARTPMDIYEIISELESKQIAPKSKLFTDGPGEKLFPLDTTFNKLNEDGVVQKYEYKYQMYGPDAYVALRPTFNELIKDIPGYTYVDNDFEWGTNAYYNGGEKAPLPMFDYDFDPKTGTVKNIKHLYVTYKKLPEETEPSQPSESTKPTEPTQPTEPSEPTETSIPTETTVPSETTVSTEPTRPTIPTKPTGFTVPSMPTEPTQPEVETQPKIQTNVPHAKIDRPPVIPITGEVYAQLELIPLILLTVVFLAFLKMTIKNN